MSVKDRSKIIDRIRAAMAIADSPTASQEERDQATRTVSRLITLHQIEMAEIRDVQQTGPAKIVNFEILLSNRFGMGLIRAHAMHNAVVAPLGGHSINFYSKKTSAKEMIRFVVFLPEDVASLAQILMSSLALQLESALTVAAKRHRRDLIDGWVFDSELNRLMREFRTSYLMAWGKTVGQRIRAARQSAQEEASEASGKEIVLADTTARAKQSSQEWAASGGITTSKPRKVKVTATGTMAGREDGMRASIGGNEIDNRRTALSR